MTTNDYKPNTFISNYITLCQMAENPLNKTQISLLEKAIYDSFGLKKNQPDLTKDAEQCFNPIDGVEIKRIAKESVGYRKIATIFNVLKEYRDISQQVSKDFPLRDIDVLRLYQITASEIEETDYVTLKEKHQIPKMYEIGRAHV